ncbi:DUF6850 family outer membrane beta-barrel protein [Sphingobacterium faecale]|uniref:DUF6850 domain-containing protein n=1 Tax=Sphingobacterium faecale TaxID=2803775 RepID=A0ABS1QZ04_9SPHI|nr:DUF6850 family outer membrane beta-barrel protein [Sphingobacterium faecale]MBL1407660.1 hypothetical protein [Sphingobacterium faecale]
MAFFKQLAYSVICSVFTLCVKAQDSSDALLDSVAPIVYWHDRAYSPMHEMTMKNRVWIRDGFKNGTSVLAISQAWGQGHLQPSQGADRIKNFRFDTEGKTRWNNTDFWGKFAYERTSEDSTALRHQTRWNEDAPFYYASMRKNKYSRETYKLDAAVQQQFMDGRIPVTLGIDYRIGSHYSNNDPRGDIADMNLELDLAVGYRSDKWSYHLRGIMGYGSERVGVGYKNDKHGVGTENPEYTNWVMKGYGTMDAKVSNIRYEDFINRKGVGANARYEIGPKHYIYFNTRYVLENQSFKETNTSVDGYQILMDYDKDIVEGELLWSKPLADGNTMILSLDGKMERGADGLYMLGVSTGQNNYVYQRDRIFGRGQYGIGKSVLMVSLGMIDLNREDGTKGNKLTYTQLNSGAGYGYNFTLTGVLDLRAEINYATRYALEHNLIMPVINEGEVARRIIHHDYWYQSATLHEWSTKWVLSNNRPHRNWSVSVQADYQRRGDLPTAELSSSYRPGRDWFQGRVSLSYVF